MSQKYRYRTLPRDPAIRSLFMNEMTANVRFVFEMGEQTVRIPAHKHALAARSNVFEAMFKDPQEDVNDVKITDVTPSSFRLFLQFFYLTEIELTAESIKDVMKLGIKYGVADCETICDKFLLDHLEDECVCGIYDLAIKFNRIEVKNLCEIFIGINASEVFQLAGFLNCPKMVLQRILRLKSLEINEFGVFKACIAWTKKASKKNYLSTDTIKNYLGDLINDIHFDLMEMDEFLTIFKLYELLFTAEKRRDIINKITAKEFQPRNNIHGRQCMWILKPIIDCNLKFNLRKSPYYIQTIESTTFSTNKAVLLRAIVCTKMYAFNGRSFINEVDDIPCIIEIFEYRNYVNGQYVYVDNEAELEYNFEDKEFNFWFEKPIIIVPEKKYEIRFKFESLDGLCTNIALTSDTEQLNDDIVVTFHDSAREKKKPNNGHERSGLFNGLRFSLF